MNRTADIKNVNLPCSDHQESCKTGVRRSDSGIALLIVLVMLAIIGALTADFAYNTQIELEAAVNMRDQLQAEYLAKSSQQFGQSLIAMQAQQAGQLGQLGKSLGIPLDNVSIIDFAKPLLQIVFGSDTNLLPNRFHFELEIIPEDGKIGLSCSGGLSPDAKQQQALYQIISSFFRFPTRTQNFYSFLGKTSSEGLQLTPENLATWLIDWMDVDLSRYNPSGPSSGAEEKYDQNVHKGHGFISQKNYEEAQEQFYKARNYRETAEVLTLIAWTYSLLNNRNEAKAYCLILRAKPCCLNLSTTINPELATNCFFPQDSM